MRIKKLTAVALVIAMMMSVFSPVALAANAPEKDIPEIGADSFEAKNERIKEWLKTAIPAPPPDENPTKDPPRNWVENDRTHTTRKVNEIGRIAFQNLLMAAFPGYTVDDFIDMIEEMLKIYTEPGEIYLTEIFYYVDGEPHARYYIKALALSYEDLARTQLIGVAERYYYADSLPF